MVNRTSILTAVVSVCVGCVPEPATIATVPVWDVGSSGMESSPEDAGITNMAEDTGSFPETAMIAAAVVTVESDAGSMEEDAGTEEEYGDGCDNPCLDDQECMPDPYDEVLRCVYICTYRECVDDLSCVNALFSPEAVCIASNRRCNHKICAIDMQCINDPYYPADIPPRCAHTCAGGIECPEGLTCMDLPTNTVPVCL